MRADVFGVPLDLLTMTATVDRCVELVESGRACQHVVINAGKVVLMHEQPLLREIVSACDLVNADGQSVVLAGRLLGVPVPERVAGIDLMERLIGEAEIRGWPTYFLGARQEVLDELLIVLQARHPALVIAGCQNGYFDDGAPIATAIRDSGARLLFVGIASPKKELFLAGHLAGMGPLLAMGVGGSFDVLAGRTKRAPKWMQQAGLEWIYRFAQEPRRMWKRYLVGNARFLVLFMREFWRVRLMRKTDTEAPWRWR